MNTFAQLGLKKEIMDALDGLGFKTPTPIQSEAIPYLLSSKKDLIALAQTGTGKTAAFSLPILNQIDGANKHVQAIIISPTRELALQTAKGMKEFAQYAKGVNIAAVYGGERIDLQIRAIKRGANIIVGTPGRVRDLIGRNVLDLNQIKWVVLDEADEMLDMGFKEDLDTILDETPKERQTLLFSATMSKSVYAIAKKYMNHAKEIRMGETNIGADNVSHEYYVVAHRDRFEALKRILDNLPEVYGIIFCRTRHETQEIADKLKQSSYSAEAIHGDVSQSLRTKIMDRFRRKQIRLLIATDVAARGIDVDDLSHVINYNIPEQIAGYTHRSGRTGRAKKSGVSICIVDQRELRRIKDLERIVKKSFDYKKIPSASDISKKQIVHFVEAMKAQNIDVVEHHHYFEDVMEHMKDLNKEEVIKYFITHTFSELLGDGSKESRDLNAPNKPMYGGSYGGGRGYRGNRRGYGGNRTGGYRRNRESKKRY